MTPFTMTFCTSCGKRTVSRTSKTLRWTLPRLISSFAGTSKGIPRAQRRGAIIILGMFAIPKPEMVQDHIEDLLKVGLGPLGRADYILAKFSCIALRRVGGSQKKVKGALADQSLRLPMDNPMFARLKDIIGKKVDQEWFGMAEQALNTIYAIGEQPDALCSEIIQDMAVAVFGGAGDGETEGDVRASAELGETQAVDDNATQREMTASTEPSRTASASAEPPRHADAFQLAQLLFTAGHIATKHLLHLELMEREFKRRKAETDKKENTKAAEKEELDQVVGSVEDDIADLVATAKERELLYGPDSLLAIFGPMAVAVLLQPKVYKVSGVTRGVGSAKADSVPSYPEPHAASGRRLGHEQVHVCQLAILRRPPHAALQSP